MGMKMAKSLEDVFKPRERVIEGATKGTLTISGKTIEYPKNLIHYGFLADLEKIGKEFEILNLYNKFQVIRKVKITDKFVIIDVMDGSKPMRFPKKTAVFYEEWTMDRGSYLIYIRSMKTFGKLATQHDPVNIIKKK
jgi:hypothetical protein